MVLALLARRKTVTRRMINPQPPFPVVGGWRAEDCAVKPRYRVGDLIWGREAWGVTTLPHAGWVDGFELHYRADGTRQWFDPKKHSMPDTVGKIRTHHQKWRPPMFMPRWASRLLHRVLDVRPERLLDITEEDALAEGIEEVARGFRWPSGETFFTSARTCYLRGYDSLHPDAPSSINPWVWRIAFEPVEVKHV